MKHYSSQQVEQLGGHTFVLGWHCGFAVMPDGSGMIPNDLGNCWDWKPATAAQTVKHLAKHDALHLLPSDLAHAAKLGKFNAICSLI